MYGAPKELWGDGTPKLFTLPVPTSLQQYFNVRRKHRLGQKYKTNCRYFNVQCMHTLGQQYKTNCRYFNVQCMHSLGQQYKTNCTLMTRDVYPASRLHKSNNHLGSPACGKFVLAKGNGWESTGALCMRSCSICCCSDVCCGAGGMYDCR